MHRKAVFSLAGVFLAVAIALPIAFLFLQVNNGLNNLIIIQNPTGTQTNGNISSVPTSQEIQQNNQLILIAFTAAEVLFVLLFTVTVYYGIKHVHPTH